MGDREEGNSGDESALLGVIKKVPEPTKRLDAGPNRKRNRAKKNRMKGDGTRVQWPVMDEGVETRLYSEWGRGRREGKTWCRENGDIDTQGSFTNAV